MANRAFVTYGQSPISSAGTAGIFVLTGNIQVMDDANTHPRELGLYVQFQFTQTPAQIQNAVIAEVINACTDAGFPVAAGSNQIFLQAFNKV
jgi:hypothetical protein